MTDLQTSILRHLYIRKHDCGRDMRRTIDPSDLAISGPTFYSSAAKLVDSGFVETWDQTKEVGGKTCQERWYRITESGREALDASRTARTPAINPAGRG